MKPKSSSISSIPIRVNRVEMNDRQRFGEHLQLSLIRVLCKHISGRLSDCQMAKIWAKDRVGKTKARDGYIIGYCIKGQVG